MTSVCLSHTGSLHRTPCRLPRQEAARGYTAKDQEFQVERSMQHFKTVVGRRVSQNPEITYANHVLLSQRLAAHMAARRGPGSDAAGALLASVGWDQGGDASAMSVSTAAASVAAVDFLRRRQPLKATNDDAAATDGRSGTFGAYYYMLGEGKDPKPEQVEAIAAAAPKLLASGHAVLEKPWRSVREQRPNWRDLAAAGSVFTEACCGAFRICSEGGGRARTRVNQYIQVTDYDVVRIMLLCAATLSVALRPPRHNAL